MFSRNIHLLLLGSASLSLFMSPFLLGVANYFIRWVLNATYTWPDQKVGKDFEESLKRNYALPRGDDPNKMNFGSEGTMRCLATKTGVSAPGLHTTAPAPAMIPPPIPPVDVGEKARSTNKRII